MASNNKKKGKGPVRIFFEIFLFLLAAGNIALAWMWYNSVLPFFKDGKPYPTYILDHLSAQLTILEIILVVIGLGFTILGILGYNEIKRITTRVAEQKALDVAEETLEKELPGLVAKFLNLLIVEDPIDEDGKKIEPDGIAENA